MTELLTTPGPRRPTSAAIADALDGARTQGATCQVHVRTGGRDVCVDAVRAPSSAWPEFSSAAARRAATFGRRLLPVLGTGQAGEWFWIAYDMGSATPLSDHRRHVLLPTGSCLRLLSDVARALDGAAADGLFAGELPPSSVFVSRRGARLGDLGTAREALRGGANEAFVPPEVLRGEPAGERSGVYLFGALLYHLLAGASPRRADRVPLASWRPDLPAAIDTVVAAAMATEPSRRPRSAVEAHELAKRALQVDSADAPETRRPQPAAPSPAPAAAKPAARNRLPALAIACGLVLGVAVGLLLGRPSPAEEGSPQVVRAGGLGVTVPSGWEGVDAGDTLSVRSLDAPRSTLEARFVGEPLARLPGSRPVRLGRHQAWLAAAPGVLRHSVPTTDGTVLITCRAPSADLKVCERAASTLRLGVAQAVPLEDVIEDENRLEAAIATLRDERDLGRARLAGALDPDGQSVIADELARSHEQAAAALDGVRGADAIESATRAAAEAYSSLAAAAESRSASGWESAREQAREADAALAAALSDRG